VSDIETTTGPATEPDGAGGVPRSIGGIRIARTGVGRLLEEQTAIDFVGRRKIGLIASGVLIIATVVSLLLQGLNLGIDFTGGVSWDVPAENGFTLDDAEQVLRDNDIETEGSRIQERFSDSGDFIKVQVGDLPVETEQALRAEFADAAGVDIDAVNVNSVSSSWGRDVTDKAVRALVVFLILVAIYISLRFEWRMAIAAILAMLHDVLISVGIYSIFQFIVTPSTVIAFLTILGYSLYDTIVVFDRVKENESRFGTVKPPYADVLNVSMNQVLMRSLNTSLSSIVPVISLLFIGSFLLGQQTLSEFALALLIGMATGTYSSIFIAVPLLAMLKTRDPQWAAGVGAKRITGEPLREMVVTGNMSGRRARARVAAASEAPAGEPAFIPVDPVEQATSALSHPPRPRKKQRR
jgi:preprotein translocase subunit SecF